MTLIARMPVWTGWEGAIGIGLGLMLLGILIGVRVVGWGKRRKGRRVANRGLRGEADGIAVLEDAGYSVLETQVRRPVVVEVDGAEETYELRVDAVVSRDGDRFVAEFKTGNVAWLGSAATRRQLLEYAVAFPDHGMLLVDANEGRVHDVSFPALDDLGR